MGRVPTLVEGVEVGFSSPQSQIKLALQACERAMAEWPNEARFVAYAALASMPTSNSNNQTLKLAQKAADMQHPIGMTILGFYRKHGLGGATRNDAVAVRLYRAAIDLGYTDARINLAFMYEDGRGVDRNYQEAIRLLRTAMDLGSPSAPGELARYYENGIGVSKDQNEANRLLRISVSRGSIFAQQRLAAKNAPQ
jgi:TPR repeat protein